MQSYPSTPVSSPALGRYLRWQLLLAVVGILLLSLLLGVTAYNVSTELVPEQGGVFREGVAGNPQTLNPLLCHLHEINQDLCPLLFRGLTRQDRKGWIVPDLAEAWTATPDGLSYTFRLRPGQFWHDGRPITIQDVLFTVETLQSEDAPIVPDLANLWRSVNVEAVDEQTVRFLLDQPFAPFLDYTTIGLLPRHIWEGIPPAQMATAPVGLPVGSGLLRVADATAEYIRLEPSPFATGDRPFVDALEFRFYPDYPSIYAAFGQDQLDGISRILPSDLPLAQQRRDLQLFSALEPVYSSILFNLNSPSVPFLQEQAVRQALYYAIDRQGLIDDLLDGQGVVAHSPIPATNWAHSQEVRQYTFDLARARQLLEEAGWVDSNGDGIRDKGGYSLSFILLANDDPLRQAMVERISGQWREIGVQAIPQTISFAGLVSDFLVPRRFDAALVSWNISGDPDPYPLWHSAQAEGGNQNYAGWRNERVDELLIEARTTVDGERRRAIYASFQQIFAEELPALPLYYPVYTYGVSTRVKNVQVGNLNTPADRFDTFPEWYIVSRRVPTNQLLD